MIVPMTSAAARLLLSVRRFRLDDRNGDVPIAAIHPRAHRAWHPPYRLRSGPGWRPATGAVRNAGSRMGESADGLTRRCWRRFLGSDVAAVGAGPG